MLTPTYSDEYDVRSSAIRVRIARDAHLKEKCPNAKRVPSVWYDPASVILAPYADRPEEESEYHRGMKAHDQLHIRDQLKSLHNTE